MEQSEDVEGIGDLGAFGGGDFLGAFCRAFGGAFG